MANYQSAYTGPEIDEAIEKALHRTLPVGGAQGQVLAKASATNFDTEWVDQAQGDVFSNRNLLDNPWFTVNQRGFSSVSEIINDYTVDRWKFVYNNDVNGNTLSYDGGLYLSRHSVGAVFLAQPYNLTDTKIGVSETDVLTASIKYGDGTILHQSGTLAAGIEAGDDTKAKIYSERNTIGGFNLVIAIGGGCKVVAVKLELGEKSTLANDTAPGYAAELLKCQRYYFSVGAGKKPIIGVKGTDGYVRCSHYFSTEMRTAPAVTITNSSNNLQYTVSALKDAVYFGTLYATAAWGDYINFIATADL